MLQAESKGRCDRNQVGVQSLSLYPMGTWEGTLVLTAKPAVAMSTSVLVACHTLAAVRSSPTDRRPRLQQKSCSPGIELMSNLAKNEGTFREDGRSPSFSMERKD